MPLERAAAIASSVSWNGSSVVQLDPVTTFTPLVP
jgi:hypothetical protein